MLKICTMAVALLALLPVPANAKKKSPCDPRDVVCRVLSNGDIEWHSTSARCVYVIAKKDRHRTDAKPIRSTCPWDKK